MTFQLIPQRPSRAIPAGELRLAVSWCRNGGTGLSGRIKKMRGMNLDLVVTAYREGGTVVGMFAPLGVGGVASDWVWIAHDETRGGRTLWDESAVVDLDMAPSVVSKLSVAVVAYKPGTSFDGIPKARLDVYGPDDSGVLAQSEVPLDTSEEGFPGNVNVAVLMDLERSGSNWTALRDARWGYSRPGDLDNLRTMMELLA